MSLHAAERATYEAIWSIDQYAERSPGERFVDAFIEMAGIVNPKLWAVLDAGAGSGKGALALQAKGFSVRMCDLTPDGLIPEAQALPFREACLWHYLKPQLGYLGPGNAVDYVYCCDVLEHIPPTFTMLVISRLLEVCKRGLFLSIYLEPDTFGAYLGKPLHQTVQSFTAWRDQIAELGKVRECRDLATTGLYWVTPR